MDPNIIMALNQEALPIFSIIHDFFCCTDANKRNDGLESLPPSFVLIPWRRVYKHPAPAPEAQNTAAHRLIMKQHWQPGELPFRGAGFFWCFTVLPRIGENISRKTEDEQTWTSKNGRGPKKGFPDQIRVDRLSTSRGGKAFEMLELTLNLEKPSVALCKIWRKSNAQAASPHTGASTSHQVDKSPIHVGPTAEMQIDKHQGQLEGEQQLMHDSELSMSGYVLVNSTQCHPNSTSGCIQATWQDDVSIYQDAVSDLYEGKESFEQLASFSKDKTHELASAAQSFASTVKNVFNFFGIKKELERTRPTDTSCYNDQIMGAGNNNVANTAEPDPEAMIGEWYSIGNDTDQDLVQLTEGHSIDNTFQELAQLTAGYSIDNDINYNHFEPDDFTNPAGWRKRDQFLFAGDLDMQ